jgi:hypothetical protein
MAIRNTDQTRALLAAKARVESMLLASGVHVDAQCQAAIGWAIAAFVDDAGLHIDDATHRVAAAFMEALPVSLQRAA